MREPPLEQDVVDVAAWALRVLQENAAIWREVYEGIKIMVGDQQWRVISGRVTEKECWALALILPNPGLTTPVRWLFIEKQENGFSSTFF